MPHLALSILRCPTRWQRSFVRLLPPVSTSVPVHDSPLWAPQAPGPTSACGVPLALPSDTWGFLLSLNHDWFACQLQRAEFLQKGSHKGPLFWIFPLSLQSIISNQMRPQRLRGAWLSRLLWHPSRRRSGSILSPRTHSPTRGCVSCKFYMNVFVSQKSMFNDYCSLWSHAGSRL